MEGEACAWPWSVLVESVVRGDARCFPSVCGSIHVSRLFGIQKYDILKPGRGLATVLIARVCRLAMLNSAQVSIH